VKLVFVNRYFHPDHSATSQLLSDLAFHLAGRGGRDVHVVASRQRYDEPQARLAPRERVDGVVVHRVWSTRFGRHWLPGRALDYATFYAAAALALWRLAARGDLIVAETDPPLVSVVAGAVARLTRARLVNWLQDVFPEVAAAAGLPVPLGGLLRRLRNGSLRGAAANVAVGDRMAERMRAEGVPAASIHVIPNWADGEAIRPLPHAQNALRREWGLADRFVVAYSGNLGRAHEYRTLLGAAERLRGEADIVFLFVGGGHLRRALEGEAAARGLGSLRFEPYQPRERLGECLGLADVHWISLLPQLEGLIVPSKVYGVLAAARPVLMVGNPDGEIGRLLRREGCGLTVPVGGDAELAEAILRLRARPDEREALGSRARAAFDARYAAAHACAAWNGLLARLSGR